MPKMIHELRDDLRAATDDYRSVRFDSRLLATLAILACIASGVLTAMFGVIGLLGAAVGGFFYFLRVVIEMQVPAVEMRMHEAKWEVEKAERAEWNAIKKRLVKSGVFKRSGAYENGTDVDDGAA